MKNIEFNSAALNLGYRYCGKNNSDDYIWIKPIGKVCLEITVKPNMENIHIASLCWIYEENPDHKYNEEEPERIPVPRYYASRNFKDERPNISIDEFSYEDFVRFIANTEYELDVTSAMSCNPYVSKNFAFKCTNDVYSMLEVSYKK